MVKAILDGKKTMTRRVIKPQPIDVIPMTDIKDGWVALIETNPNRGKWIKCRYGQVGDRLWVRETWWTPPHNKIDKNPAIVSYKEIIYSSIGGDATDRNRWYPSIFMPRWASRITLEITDIRVERLQEITEEDAKDEGIKVIDKTPDGMYSPPNYPDIHRDIFIGLWDSLNAKYRWESNPFVWCISFKKLD